MSVYGDLLADYKERYGEDWDIDYNPPVKEPTTAQKRKAKRTTGKVLASLNEPQSDTAHTDTA